MANIFCVEDDTGIRELITCALQSGGYTAEGFPDGKSFFHRLRDDKPALILLDIMLPDEDGISILKRLKGNDATAEIPVIMLSAKSSEIDKVTGLENGADDYITKPFGIMELLSRIKAVLRRSHTVQKAESHVLSAHDLTIDLDQRTVVYLETEIVLTYKEFELLTYFMENQGIALSREKILNHVWNYDYFGDARTIDTHVKKLRSKMGDKGDYIKTIWGMGYKFEVDQ